MLRIRWSRASSAAVCYDPLCRFAGTDQDRVEGFFLLALIASIFVRTLKYQLASHPYQLERCFASYLLCLAIADLTHIGFTLYDLGSTNAFKLSDWNMLIWGNVGITTGLFVVRSLWFLGVGREVVDSTARKAKETVVETAKTSAKQTRRAIKETTPEAQEDDSSEEDEPRKMVTRSSSRSPRKTYRR